MLRYSYCGIKIAYAVAITTQLSAGADNGLNKGTEMKSNLKVSLLVGALASLSAFASGCGNSKTTAGVTIVTYNGNRGYYSGATFCYWGNNYCNSGKAYGITYPAIVFYNNYYGYYYNSVFCDFTNDYCGTDLSWGIADDGTVWNNGSNFPGSNGSSNGSSNGGYSPGSSSGGASNGSSSGGTSGGSTSGGSTSGGSTSGGSTSGGSTSGGSTSGGSTSGGSTSGGFSGSGGSGGGSGGSGGSNGFAFSVNAGPTTAGECTSVDGCVAAAGNIQLPASLLGANASADPFSQAQDGIANSIDTDTKDVDLQRADLQGAALDSQAQSMASQFGMSFDSARQLAQLADKVSTLSSTGQVSEEDREAITHAALGVAGLSADDVNAAIAATISGDQGAMDNLMAKAATNLGMQSSAGLRDQLLPQLGINF